MKKKSLILLLLLLIGFLPAALGQRTVSGVVTSTFQNEGLSGASVRLVGTQVAAIADSMGRFSISLPESLTEPRLEISFAGYNSREVMARPGDFLQIQLEPSRNSLEEVVVIGYGKTKNVNLTGSVSVISSKDIESRQTGQTSMALQGLAPGLTITQNSGQPGNDAGTIRIRGVGTLGTAGQAPLVLVDGVEMELNNVDPNDIESISVLKDAASAAIYGSRAANGVILVTTRRAKSGKVAVNYNGFVGKQTANSLPKLVNGLDHMLLLNEARVNMGLAPTFTEDYINEYRQKAPSDLFPDSDWQDLTLTGNGLMNSNAIDISGGNEFIRTRASFNRFEQGAIIPNTGYRRNSIRINTDIKASDYLSFKFDLRGVSEHTYEPGINPNSIFNYMNGRVPANQEGVLSNGLYGQGWLGENSVAAANASGSNNERTLTGILNLQADWKPIRGMNINLLYSPEYISGNNKLFRKTYQTYFGDGTPAYPNPSTTNFVLQSSIKNLANNIRALVTYDFNIRRTHDFKLLAGYEQREVSSELFTARRENLILQDYPVLNSGSLTNQQITGAGENEFGLVSYFGRLNYSFKEKYLLEANLRYDGSSRFAKGNQFGLFPSFSVGWRISQEKFMESVKFVNNLKLRASYGSLGNQNIGNYPFASLVDLNRNYLFNGAAVPGAALVQLGNTDISWEKTTMFNVAFDARLWNRLSITAEYYVRNTTDILLQLPIPNSTGLGAPFQNAGKVRNTGYDITIGYGNQSGEFKYNVDLVFSDVRNKITDLRNTGPFINDVSIRQVGIPIDAFFGYQSAGLFQSAQEVANHATQFGGSVSAGDIKYVDQNGDGIINAEDRVVLGSDIPRYTYGLTLSGSYKGFDLSCFIQGVGKADSYLSGYGVWAFYVGGTAYEKHFDRWSPNNPGASYPRLTFGDQNNEQISDYWMIDASYMRVKNLQLGYSLPRRLLNRIRLQNMRFWVAGQNLFTIDNFLDGFDPETPKGGINRYPIVKVVSMGLQLNF